MWPDGISKEQQIARSIDKAIKDRGEIERLRTELAALRSMAEAAEQDHRREREEMLALLGRVTSALDCLMGDTDIDGDDSEEFRAMQAASDYLGRSGDSGKKATS